ncbi:phosphotransferase family protein [Nocardioides terrisoli]|uniref:phosphotransferase family protein n=1 Tax=Nocardioides terrisoli TaxID=3388267 RepID=UPI00287B75F6|nr:phosphotransferase [Nocardioides marmorisolisilvae]
MWQPEPDWEQIPGGGGACTVGVWRTRAEGRTWVVKRVRAPAPGDDPELSDPGRPAYWHREAEVAQALRASTGLVPPAVRRLEEDPDGFTLWTEAFPRDVLPALFVARALGRFAETTVPSEVSAVRSLLHERFGRAEARGGWPTLRRTPVAALTDTVWGARAALLTRFEGLPVVPAHGDVVPANLLTRQGDDVITVDWGLLGLAPAGADLGYFALSCRDGFDVLLEGYCTALAEVGVPVDVEDVAFAARLVAVHTVLARAEWALTRVARGEGPLEAKFRHPAVAPHLRALQRQLPQVEALLSVVP